MKPAFDNNGLATQAGDIRCFYYDAETGEYTGWSDEYINAGVSMPGNSTDIDPGDEVAGSIAVFSGDGWEQQEDHRGEIVYSTEDGTASTIDYIGEIKDGFTAIAPGTPYDVWDGQKWVTDSEAQHAADVATAEQKKAALLIDAQEAISIWQTELQLEIISDDDKASLINWLSYIKEIQAMDTSSAPDINWPESPEA